MLDWAYFPQRGHSIENLVIVCFLRDACDKERFLTDEISITYFCDGEIFVFGQDQQNSQAADAVFGAYGCFFRIIGKN